MTIGFLTELLFLGMMGVIFGTLVGIIVQQFSKDNKLNTLIVLFFTNISIHTFLELTGFNKWYCKNGIACL